MALRNRAVEISSIVRVILRMLRIDLRRRSSARALAIGNYRSSGLLFARIDLLELRDRGVDLGEGGVVKFPGLVELLV